MRRNRHRWRSGEAVPGLLCHEADSFKSMRPSGSSDLEGAKNAYGHPGTAETRRSARPVFTGSTPARCSNSDRLNGQTGLVVSTSAPRDRPDRTRPGSPRLGWRPSCSPACFRNSAMRWLRPPDLHCTMISRSRSISASRCGTSFLRHQLAADVGDLIFERLAHIENEQILACVHAPFQFLHADLRNSILQCALLFRCGRDAAELLIVDQLRHRGMLAANRALGILAQLQLPEAHVERIHQQQAPDERLAFAENELDGLRRLDDADQAGQNSQHSALGATRHKARRRRLGIQAAITWPILSGEDAGLAFEAEDRSVRVRLAQQHACVVHQIARGEVVRAVGDDVVVLQDVERVGAG